MSLFSQRKTDAPNPPNQLIKIWSYRSFAIAVERENPNQKISSLVYSGEKGEEGAVRRLRFSPSGEVSLEWEYTFGREHFSNYRYGRFEDLLLLPGQEAGVAAFDLQRGEPRWEIGHRAPLYQPIYRTSSGSLLLVFRDQVWLEVDPKSGLIQKDGSLRNEEELRELTREKEQLLSDDIPREVYYGGHRICAGGDLIVDEWRSNERTSEEEPPKAGEYPIEEWEPNSLVSIVGKKLILWLTKRWERTHHKAVGIFALPTLVPLRLIQLGDNVEGGDCDGLSSVDGLLLFGSKTRSTQDPSESRYAKFLVDPIEERLLAVFVSDEDSAFFFQEEPYWQGLL